MAPPSALLDTPSMVNFLTLQGSKVDLEGARSTSSSLGDSPAMRLGVGVHPTGPARSMDLVPRGEPYSLACLDLAWLAAARCLYKARRPTCGREGVSPAHSAVRYALPCITVKAGPATRGLWRQCVFCFCIPFLLVSCSGDLLSCAELWLMGLCRVSMQWAGRRETLNPDSLHQWQGCAVLHVMSPCWLHSDPACTLCKRLPAEPNTVPVSHSQQPGLQGAMQLEHTRWMASQQAPPSLPSGSAAGQPALPVLPGALPSALPPAIWPAPQAFLK